MNSRNSHLVFQTWFIWLMMFVTLYAQEPRIGGSARLESWKRHREMAGSSPFRELKWQSMGPKFAGGRIESIDAPRNDQKTIYAGVGAGGIWKTVNGGLTWKPIFHQESTFAIGDLAVAPSDPHHLGRHGRVSPGDVVRRHGRVQILRCGRNVVQSGAS